MDPADAAPLLPTAAIRRLRVCAASRSTGRLNCFGQPCTVATMQSEAGAAGSLHGALAGGGLTTTFTASQGLLLMIPNMYLIAGELMPTVIHVSARAVAKHALTIFNDHSDVMAVRQTGFAMLCSNSVQEIMDLGLVSHLATLKARVPFVHFFDGYRTSAQINKINVLPYDAIEPLIPQEALQTNLRDLALNPVKPIIRGTGQRPDIFMQASVASHRFYLAAPQIVQETMDEVAALTGRQYKLYDYYGAKDADRVVVAMGSACRTLEECADHLNRNGEKVGVLAVRLFRPFEAEAFRAAIPKTAKTISVLDRTREDGALGMPLYLDTCVAFSEAGDMRKIVGGQFGLASKEFTPAMAMAVFENLKQEAPMNKFVIGVQDDVTHTSMQYGKEINVLPDSTKQCVFWGFGTDGTVGANKQAIKTIGHETPLWTQGHFAYDSHKGGGVTMSHLRFGPEPIKAEYEIHEGADYIACHNSSYVHKFDMLAPIKTGGIFVLNWNRPLEELDMRIPNEMKEQIANNNLSFYTIDATRIALDVGLGQRINMVMQAAFYHLSGVLPNETALDILKADIEKTYGKKGPKVVKMNCDAVDRTVDALKKMDIPAGWATATSNPEYANARSYRVAHTPEGPTSFTAVTDRFNEDNRFVEEIMHPVVALKGDQLPVSAFEPGGAMPVGTTQYEKRGIAPEVPVWIPDKCTQCNYCTIVCPHAVIRPFLYTKDELKSAPDGFEARKAQGGAEMAGLNYSIQLATLDCTGCEVCVKSCPDDALYMAPFAEAAEAQIPGWDFSLSVPNKGHVSDKFTVKGSQFQEPLMEFSGACSGCGETPYVKLMTQLFGDRLMIANASGCSSVWGGTSTTNPYRSLSASHEHAGRGPAWGRSLFEDNAEYGLGMALATAQRRNQVKKHVENAIADPAVELSPQLEGAMTSWLEHFHDMDTQSKYADEVMKLLKEGEGEKHHLLKHIQNSADLLPPVSHWIIGGDGWAYDIGYGGVDHVLARGENVNILVLDTEMYSNTGGQVSKSTSQAAVVKFASGGKPHAKKDLGHIAMLYENVYVASIAMGANYAQAVQAFKEAEEYNGTSLIIAYSPCIDWGIEMKNMMNAQKAAVDSGYWPLYRYDPRRVSSGETPFQLDSRRIKGDLITMLESENRFATLSRNDPEHASKLRGQLGDTINRRMHKMKRSSMDEFELLDELKKLVGEQTGEKITILYASETGNTADLAKYLAYEMKRRDVRTQVLPYDDFAVEDLAGESVVINLAATCGQGEWPQNSRNFWAEISDPDLPSDLLKDTKFATFAMGDSGYVFYNEVGKLMDERFTELGGQRIMPLGLGDDQAEDKWETAWEEWEPELWNELGTPPPPQELLPASHLVKTSEAGTKEPSAPFIVPQDAGGPGVMCPLVVSQPLTPGGRDVRHFEWDITDTGISYEVGDALGVFSTNAEDKVADFLEWYGLRNDDIVELKDIAGTATKKLPEVVTAGQLFTQHLDIFGRPKRQFYEMLSIITQDADEKARLQHLVSKEGREDLRALINDTVTYADLLKMFPGADVPLEYLLDFVPAIKPRLYSIASAPEMHPDRIHLCIVEEDWERADGEMRRGQSTWFMRNNRAGLSWGNTKGLRDAPEEAFGELSREEAPKIPVRVNPAVVHVPEDPTVPLVMVGLGTGMAPFRAFIQQRKAARDEGQEVGKMLLYFGARYEKTEYLYGDEIEAYHAEGLLTDLKKAFSRDQPEKIYAQHRILEDPQLIYDYMVRDKGYFYLCGPAGAMPAQMKAAVIEAFQVAGGHSEEEATKMVTDMMISGHYNVEVW